jgi:hypothetical protein
MLVPVDASAEAAGTVGWKSSMKALGAGCRKRPLKKKLSKNFLESFGSLKISITFASAIENEGFAAVTMRK